MLVLRYCNKDAERREKREKGKRLATEVIGKYQQNKVHIQIRYVSHVGRQIVVGTARQEKLQVWQLNSWCLTEKAGEFRCH